MLVKTIAAIAVLLPTVSAAHASPAAEAWCIDRGVQHLAGNVLGDWSQNYPFAKVIIGADGQSGQVLSPVVAVEAETFVVCRGTYQLQKVAADGHTYTVRIPAFFYRVNPNNDGYAVTLEDFPTPSKGSSINSRELLSRFTIDGRPYLAVLEENRRRLQVRGRRAGR